MAEKMALSLMGSECSQPFGFNIGGYKAFGKMFLFGMHYQGQHIVTLKCSPDYAVMLRDIYSSIKAGFI